MLSIRLRPLVLALVAMLVLVGCGGDDSDDGGSSSASGSSPSAAEDASVDSADDGFDQEAFCDAAGDFAIASDGGPDASTPEEVEERVTAMSDAADAVAETVPEDITEEAQAFADAIDGLEQYAAARDYEVRLGGGSPEYQSGAGAAVAEEITGTIAPVDQAVQDECDRFLSEAP